MTNTFFLASAGRPLEALNLARRAALIGGGAYGLRADWIAAARAEAIRASYHHDTQWDGLFSGVDPDLEGAIYEAIII